jgi:hypothetical protein
MVVSKFFRQEEQCRTRTGRQVGSMKHAEKIVRRTEERDVVTPCDETVQLNADNEGITDSTTITGSTGSTPLLARRRDVCHQKRALSLKRISNS